MAYWSPPISYLAGTLIRAEDANADNDGIASSFALLPAANLLTHNTVNYAADTGVADAYAISVGSFITALSDGLQVTMKVGNANTGACTLDVNSLGAVAIKRPNGSDPLLGDLVANQIMTLRYNTAGPYWQILTATQVDSDAATSAAAAEAWAITPEDVLVPTVYGGDGVNDYSALHHAAKAAASNRQRVMYNHESGTLALVAQNALVHDVSLGDSGSLQVSLPTGTKFNGETVLISKYSGAVDLQINFPAGETVKWSNTGNNGILSQVSGNLTFDTRTRGQLRCTWEGAEWRVTGVA